MIYLGGFLIAAFIAWMVSAAIRRIALRYKLVDVPDAVRKLHARPTPLVGGVAIFSALIVTIVLMAILSPVLLSGGYEIKQFIGFFLGGLTLMVGGYLDDRYHLRPRTQLAFPLIAALIVMASGIGIRFITNPLGGVISLEGMHLADIFTVCWLLVTMYAFKVLDGIDGLASSVGIIGSVITFLVSMRYPYNQPDAALFAIIAAGAFLGFLIWNFPPARLFLGEGGSLLVGFVLGVLAILSGSKIATALLVAAFPLVDMVYVVLRRIFVLKKSPFVGDREHLHFRLLDLGLSQRVVVGIFVAFALLFGLVTLLFPSFQKAIILGILLVIAFGFERIITRRRQSSKPLM
ncbi:MAG: MraY family glycosyltransferase [bacterium]|nr:MraY family glycosyltransferase [bacterium]